MDRLTKREHKEFMKHFPKKMTKDMVDYVTDVVFKWSRYIFTWRQGKQQYGYCTHCKNEFKTEGLKHKSDFECPVCHSRCKVRASGISRKRMVDDAYFVYYEKSVVNPNAIVAKGIYVVRDYRSDFRKTETFYGLKSLYLFEQGKSQMIYRYAYYSDAYGMSQVGNWYPRKNVRSELNTSMANISSYCSYDSIKAAIKDTPFQNSTWESYQGGDMVEFFDLYSKYPCIEYLTKLDMKEVVQAKLVGMATYGAVHWRGKNILSVLRLTKQALSELKSEKAPIDLATLRLMQISTKDKSNFSLQQIKNMRKKYGLYLEEVQKILKYTTLKKFHSYVQKQYTLKNLNRRYYDEHQVIFTWRDYIRDCRELDMDLTLDSVLFPTDLHKAHQTTIERVKSTADALLNSRIQKRAESLEHYCFEANGYLIRPAQDANEVIREGNVLHHCVGGYVRPYGFGKTTFWSFARHPTQTSPSSQWK